MKALMKNSVERERAPEETSTDGLALVGQEAETSDLGRVPQAVEEVVRAEEGALPPAVEARDRTIVARLFRDGAEPREVALDHLPALIKDNANFVWVDLSTYNENDLWALQRLLGIGERAIHAILSPWRRPSLVVYPDYFLASATIARLDPAEYQVHAGQLDLIAGHNVLISAHKQPLPFADRALARVRHSPEVVQGDSIYMLYILFDELLAYYEDVNRHLQAQVEDLEEQALHADSDRFLERLLRFRRYGFALFQLVDEHRELLEAFLRPDFRWVSNEDVDRYFRDLSARLAHLLGTMRGLREAINGAFQVYASHMVNRTNQVIKVLTLVSAILFSATAIIYLFGVSAATAFRGFTSPATFMLMVAAIVAVSCGILLAFRRRGWL